MKEGALEWGIRALPEDERPREKLIRLGPAALSPGELVAVVIRTGAQAESAVAVGERLLTHLGGLRGLNEATVEEMIQVRGMGMAKAAQMAAAMELGRRAAALGPSRRATLTSPQEVADLVMAEMRFLDREHFKAILLDTRMQLLHIRLISVGTLNASLVHPRELFREAIRRSAASMVLVHNHPSGDPSPSQEDIVLTHRLREVGRIVGIEVLDHIVIGDNRFVSLKEMGVI